MIALSLRIAVSCDDKVASPWVADESATLLNVPDTLVNRERHPVAGDDGVKDCVWSRELGRHEVQRIHALDDDTHEHMLIQYDQMIEDLREPDARVHQWSRQQQCTPCGSPGEAQERPRDYRSSTCSSRGRRQKQACRRDEELDHLRRKE